MAKFSGLVGFVKTVETAPDIWETVETSRLYYGDVLRRRMVWEKTTNPNENLNVSNEISILADDFVKSNIGFIKWVEFMGEKWMVTSISVEYPRLVLSIGGLYNGG